LKQFWKQFGSSQFDSHLQFEALRYGSSQLQFEALRLQFDSQFEAILEAIWQLSV
jgi:hypothetical protein